MSFPQVSMWSPSELAVNPNSLLGSQVGCFLYIYTPHRFVRFVTIWFAKCQIAYYLRLKYQVTTLNLQIESRMTHCLTYNVKIMICSYYGALQATLLQCFFCYPMKVEPFFTYFCWLALFLEVWWAPFWWWAPGHCPNAHRVSPPLPHSVLEWNPGLKKMPTNSVNTLF